jgi:hypothetical protein
MYAETVKHGAAPKRGALIRSSDPHQCSESDATYHIYYDRAAENSFDEYSFAASAGINAQHPNHSDNIILMVPER